MRCLERREKILNCHALAIAGIGAFASCQWLAHQITEAFPWDTAATFLIRDNDCAYGEVFARRVRSMGHSRPPHHASIVMAERTCRAHNRLDPT
jgi:hypothetical protein